MALHCKITPTVKNKRGEEVDSKLYKDLLSLTSKNRDQALNIYTRTLNDKFKKQMKSIWKEEDYDENGEPKIGPLLQFVDVSSYIPDIELINKISAEEKLLNKDGISIAKEYTAKNVLEAYRKAEEFNNNSKYKGAFYQEVVVDRMTNTIQNNIVRNTPDVEIRMKQKRINYELYNNMINILNQAGVGVTNLTSMEERLGINGITDFDACKDLASGLVDMIRLAKGKRGIDALPEEFAHAVIELLGDNTLVTRLYNALSDESIVRGILGKNYDRYAKEYNNDRNRLIKEAAGQLVAHKLLHPDQHIKVGFEGLVDRIVQFIKQIFGRIDETKIQKAIDEADVAASSLAKNVIEGRLNSEMSLLNIKGKEVLYSLSDVRSKVKQAKNSVERITAINSELIENLHQEALIRDKKLSENLEGKTTRALVSKMLSQIASTNATVECVNQFLQEGTKLFSLFMDLNTGVINTAEYGAWDTDKKLRNLMQVRLYCQSFSSIFTNLEQIISELPLADRTLFNNTVKVSLNQAQETIKKMMQFYNTHSKALLVEKISPFWTDFQLPFESYRDSKGKKHYRKGELITLEKVLAEAENGDISAIDRWFESMATSNDSLLRLADKMMKSYKETVRTNAIEYKKQLLAAGIKLEQSGIKGTEWMFEHDDDGNVGTRYISEINYTKYKAAEKKIQDSLDAKYGTNPSGTNAKLKDAELNNWYAVNWDKAKGQPVASLYPGNLKTLSAAQKEYYDAVMNIYKDMNSRLPSKYANRLDAVFIRKDAIERIKSAKGLINSLEAAKDAFWDTLIVRSDDNDFYTGSKDLLDFDGNPIKSIPILYTGMKQGDNISDMSLDVTSSMIAYCEMALNYEQMNKIADTMDLLIEQASERETADVSSGGKVVSKLKKWGHDVTHTKQTPKGTSHIEAKLRDYVDMHVYNEKEVDEGTITVFGKKVAVAKLVDTFNWLTSQDTLALNFLSNISNITTGMSMMEAEAVGGRYFSLSNMKNADKHFFGNLHHYVGEMNDRVKSSQLALFAEKFNVLQKFESEIKDVDFDKKGIIRMFGSEILFLGQDAGEFWMQMRTAMALADNIKLVDAQGNEVTLWDAYERVWIDDNNHALGARLQLKKGLKKADGTAWTAQDEIAFTNKAKAINQQMHGIYNVMDRAMIQRYAIGRLALMYRKYIVPSIQRRWDILKRNEDLDDYTEGFYRSFCRFLTNIFTGCRNGQTGIAANWNAMTDLERQNCKKAMFELGKTVLLFVTIAFAYGGLLGDDDDKNKKKKKKERSHFDSLVEYQCRRLFNELAAFTPTPWAVFESIKLLDSPMAGISTLQKIANLVNTLNPTYYETFYGKDALIKTGYWKDYSKAQKLWLKYIPYYGTFTNFLDVEGKIQFFKKN